MHDPLKPSDIKLHAKLEAWAAEQSASLDYRKARFARAVAALCRIGPVPLSADIKLAGESEARP